MSNAGRRAFPQKCTACLKLSVCSRRLRQREARKSKEKGSVAGIYKDSSGGIEFALTISEVDPLQTHLEGAVAAG